MKNRGFLVRFPIIDWNIQDYRQYFKSTKHTSLTAGSDPMFYFFSLALNGLNGFFIIKTSKTQDYGLIIWVL